MIRISVDEAAAYDMLAILSIKIVVNGGNDVMPSRVVEERLTSEAVASLGESLHGEIMSSPEYKRLLRANLAVFDRIDLIKTRGEQLGDATYIDQQNYQRYLCKKALQERFFPQSSITEQKLGYTTTISLDSSPKS